MTEDEFHNFIDINITKLEKVKGDMSAIMELFHIAIKNFIPCDTFHILQVDAENNRATCSDTNNDKQHFYSLDTKGILSQCYQSRQPLFVNDTNRSLLYNDEIDGLGEKNITKILVVPVLDNNESKDVIGIIWVGVRKGFKQFIRQDIDVLVRFTNATKHYMFITNISSVVKDEDTLAACRESKQILKVEMERNENYFASTIHDIRTPMNAVIGFMELMMLNETDEQKKEYIDATLKSGEHIVSLINDALDMSKISKGKMSLDKSTFSPVVGLSDIAKLFYNNMQKNSIDFSIYIDPLTPELITSDLHRIKQIVNNLLSNALKFTPVDGKVMLEAIYDKKEDTLQISIIDTGIGIAKEKQKSIFSPYSQETDATAKEYGGTGLGLAISQQLSILLNGTLTLESVQGEGSKFIFTLPCDTPSTAKETITKEYFKDISVLIYANNNMETLQRYLKTLEMSYTYLENTKPLKIKKDTVLILEKKDAIKYSKDIQKHLDKNRHILLVDNNFDTEECRFSGSVKLIHHPILPETLFKSLQFLLHPEEKKEEVENVWEKYEKLKGYNVLVIDDNIINLKLMVEILKRFQLNITTSINAKEALEVLKTEKFDVIFIDQNMPIMNGDEAIMEIRKNEKINNDTPSVIYGLTGDVHNDIIEKIMKAGANDVYTKPIHLNEVYEAVFKASIT